MPALLPHLQLPLVDCLLQPIDEVIQHSSVHLQGGSNDQQATT
jgi:hypothetical protein